MSSRDGQRRAVPNFSSFKPKSESESEPLAQPSPERKVSSDHTKDKHYREGRDREKGREKLRDHEHRHRHDDEGGGHHNHGRRSPSPRSSRHERHHHNAPSSSRHYEHKDKPKVSTSLISIRNDLFFTDTRGDPLILRYGTNDRSKVPSYRRFGAGQLMGCPNGRLDIHYEGSREKFTIRDSRRQGGGGGSVFRDKAVLRATAASRANAKRITTSSSAKKGPLPTKDEDFVSLEPPRKRARRGDESEDEQHQEIPDYRSIYGKAKPDDESDGGSESASDNDGSVSSQQPGGDEAEGQDGKPKSRLFELTVAKKRSIELHQRVRDHPHDINAWLALIRLQSRLFREDLGGGDDYVQARSYEEAQALAKLKLSLYEEVLPHASSRSDREAVLEGLMAEGAKVWDPKTLAKRWAEVTESDDGRQSFVLWRARLNYELAQVDKFSFEELRDFITDRLRILSQNLFSNPAGSDTTDGNQDQQSLEVLTSQIIYVFLRLTRFLQDSGYSELAVAAWQATLELSFSRPSQNISNPDDTESSLASFADFWESEVPRIGENDAKGWRHFVEAADELQDPPEPKKSTPAEQLQTRDPFKAWGHAERQEAIKARMPARTLDEGTEDDPFRVVMFSDIKDFLVWLPVQVLPLARPQLMDAFLAFCQLPTPRLSSATESWVLAYSSLNEPFLATSSGEAFETALRGHDPSKAQEPRKTPEFDQQCGNIALSQDVLFAGSNWFQYLGKWSDNTNSKNNNRVDPSWVLGTLRYLVRTCGLEGLAEYYLALEWRQEPAAARKVAKALLKQYSSNMRLYNAYALIEWANGNRETSEKVLASATAIAATQKLSINVQLLWNTWAWLLLESGQKELALHCLCASADPTSVSPPSATVKTTTTSSTTPVMLLKARTHFSSARDYSISSRDLETATQHAESLALFEYLCPTTPSATSSSSVASNLDAALQSITSFCSELTTLTTTTTTTRQNKTNHHHERTLQTASRLLYHHATHVRPYRPSEIRSQLSSYISIFPHNTLFLELLAWFEQSTLRIVDDPVRSALRRALSGEDEEENDTRDGQQQQQGPDNDILGSTTSGTVTTTRRFSILHELRTGTVHSVKAAFEDALTTGTGGGDVDLWIGYLRFRYRQMRMDLNRFERARKRKGGSGEDAREAREIKAVKELFYRAVAACPWSKRIYMVAFDSGNEVDRDGGMVSIMGSSELKTVANAMVTKGLRVHVGLDSFLEGRKG